MNLSVVLTLAYGFGGLADDVGPVGGVRALGAYADGVQDAAGVADLASVALAAGDEVDERTDVYALAGVIFHELAHQVLYVDDDSSFNEAFATAVEEVGVERWLRQSNDSESVENYLAEKRRQDLFHTRILPLASRILST